MALPARSRTAPAGRRRYHLRYAQFEWGDPPRVDRLPMARVELSWKGRAIETKMLLDTGANMSFLPRWMAEDLGLDLGGTRSAARAAAGSMATVYAEVDFRLMKRSTLGQSTRVRRLAPVAIPTDEPDPLPYPVLGRYPFFRWYEVTFRDEDEEIILRG